MQQIAPPPPVAPARQLALPAPAGPPQAFQPLADIWTFHVPETERHMLGEKGNLTARVMEAAINAYDAAHPGTPIDLNDVKSTDFRNHSSRDLLRNLMRGKVQITCGNDNRLVNK